MFKIKNKKIVLGLLIVAATLVFAGLGCKKKTTETIESTKKITLTYWRLWDPQDVFFKAMEEYRKMHPNVKIEYKKLTYEEYESTVVESLAAGKGPDIWSIHNSWIPKHLDKLAPAPLALITPTKYEETFAQVAADDFIYNEEIYGVPFSIDTLALYYNKDLFNGAAIANPPTNWEEFKEDVKKLTKTDSAGNITQSGTALGTAKNVNRAVDILYLLMLQNGTKMTSDDHKTVLFNKTGRTKDGNNFNPGLDSLIFYTDFASPKKTVYTWNPSMANSIDAFTEEKTAMMFNYFYQNAIIQAKTPRLNYGVAPIPQLENDAAKAAGFANYWGEVVSGTSPNKEVAWDFLMYLSTKENLDHYATATKRPASRRDIIEKQLEDPQLKTFAKQALSAKTWYQKDAAVYENIFVEAIESVALGEKEAKDALKDAETQISTIIYTR